MPDAQLEALLQGIGGLGHLESAVFKARIDLFLNDALIIGIRPLWISAEPEFTRHVAQLLVMHAEESHPQCQRRPLRPKSMSRVGRSALGPGGNVGHEQLISCQEHVRIPPGLTNFGVLGVIPNQCKPTEARLLRDAARMLTLLDDMARHGGSCQGVATWLA